MPQARFDASLYLLRARVFHMQLTLCLPLGRTPPIAAMIAAVGRAFVTEQQRFPMWPAIFIHAFTTNSNTHSVNTAPSPALVGGRVGRAQADPIAAGKRNFERAPCPSTNTRRHNSTVLRKSVAEHGIFYLNVVQSRARPLAMNPLVAITIAATGGMGICGARREQHHLLVGARDWCSPGELPGVRDRQRLADSPGRIVQAERLRAS